jgi:hypothetical protein
MDIAENFSPISEYPTNFPPFSPILEGLTAAQSNIPDHGYRTKCPPMRYSSMGKKTTAGALLPGYHASALFVVNIPLEKRSRQVNRFFESPNSAREPCAL